jgi:hypothetical protein
MTIERLVRHPDRPSAVELGSHPAVLTANHGRGGLDGDLPLATCHLGGEDLRALQAEQPGG